jgi:YHS domain-containing protein
MKKTIFTIFMLLGVIASSFLFPQSTLADTKLIQVESKYVCMITNKLFTDKQIEVDIEGRKYYGCCDMCKGKLVSDLASRKSIDPISGKQVDKATSVIGAANNGNVYYFENEKNFNIFNGKQ